MAACRYDRPLQPFSQFTVRFVGIVKLWFVPVARLPNHGQVLASALIAQEDHQLLQFLLEMVQVQ